MVLSHGCLSDAHVLKLLLHDGLVLYLSELLLHHLHCLGICLHLGVHVALCCLSCPCVTHHHVLHHVGERVGTHPTLLLSIWLASPSGHYFVKHCLFLAKIKLITAIDLHQTIF